MERGVGSGVNRARREHDLTEDVCRHGRCRETATVRGNLMVTAPAKLLPFDQRVCSCACLRRSVSSTVSRPWRVRGAPSVPPFRSCIRGPHADLQRDRRSPSRRSPHRLAARQPGLARHSRHARQSPRRWSAQSERIRPAERANGRLLTSRCKMKLAGMGYELEPPRAKAHTVSQS